MTSPSDKPWLDEPNQEEFVSSTYHCAIVRHPTMGHLCGYVAVQPGHPFWGKDYDSVDVEVHGGLTWAANTVIGIMHPAPDLWWFGFDCAHLFDLVPQLWEHEQPGGMFYGEFRTTDKDTYRNWAYVRGEVEGLAAQFAKAEVLVGR